VLADPNGHNIKAHVSWAIARLSNPAQDNDNTDDTDATEGGEGGEDGEGGVTATTHVGAREELERSYRHLLWMKSQMGSGGDSMSGGIIDAKRPCSSGGDGSVADSGIDCEQSTKFWFQILDVRGGSGGTALDDLLREVGGALQLLQGKPGH
jgi:hypothetical protein